MISGPHSLPHLLYSASDFFFFHFTLFWYFEFGRLAILVGVCSSNDIRSPFITTPLVFSFSFCTAVIFVFTVNYFVHPHCVMVVRINTTGPSQFTLRTVNSRHSYGGKAKLYKDRHVVLSGS